MVLDESGNVKSYYDYYPYGKLQRASVAGLDARYKFTGKELDDEGGLNWNYFSARYYDPEIGRFLSVDPLAEEYPSLSPYCYAANNPIILVDTDGMAIGFGGQESSQFNYSFSQYVSEQYSDPGFFSAILEGAKTALAHQIEAFSTDGLTKYLKANLGLMLGLLGNGGIMTEENLQRAEAEAAFIKNIPNLSSSDGGFALGYGGTLAGEVYLLSKGTSAAFSRINYFGLRNGYGVFGKNALKIGNYKIDALYANPTAGRGYGTIFSMMQMKRGGALFRWDYGPLHSGGVGLHSTIRFYYNGIKYGSTAQRTWYPSMLKAPFFRKLN